MVGMDVLCSDKTNGLTLNCLTIEKNLIEVQNILSSIISVLKEIMSLSCRREKISSNNVGY
jgi:hypothetical protein